MLAAIGTFVRDGRLRRLVWPAPVLGLLGAAALAGVQLANPPAATIRDGDAAVVARAAPAAEAAASPAVELLGGLVPVDLATTPAVGPADASERVAVMLDYACPHCRVAHGLLLDRGVRLLLLPVPLNAACNDAFQTGGMPARFDDSCAVAEAGVATFLAGGEAAYATFDAAVFARRRPARRGRRRRPRPRGRPRPHRRSPRAGPSGRRRQRRRLAGAWRGGDRRPRARADRHRHRPHRRRPALRPRRPRHAADAMRRLLPLLLLTLLAFPAAAEEAPAVAMLRYAGGKTGECFSDRFLAGFNAATDAAVAPALARVEALDLTAEAHPVALLTGEGPFRLKPGEADALRRFVASGGLLIASTGCSDPAWTASLEGALPSLLPPDANRARGPPRRAPRLPADHPRRDLHLRQGAPPRLPRLRGFHRPDGSLAFVWSPEGLNDTLGVAGPCCCCGGNEVRAAEPLLINLLAVALDADPATARKPE